MKEIVDQALDNADAMPNREKALQFVPIEIISNTLNLLKQNAKSDNLLTLTVIFCLKDNMQKGLIQ